MIHMDLQCVMVTTVHVHVSKLGPLWGTGAVEHINVTEYIHGTRHSSLGSG